MMKIREVMTDRAFVAQSTDTLRHVAEIMQREDIGSVPISENDKLVGMVTDRDIVIRAVAAGMDLDTAVREVMTAGVKYCFDDETVDDVARNMAELGVRRLPVMDRSKQLVGYVSLANIADSDDVEATGELLDGTATAH
jgi:CBS domain-containing protein